MGLLLLLDGRMELTACLLFHLVIKMVVLGFCEKKMSDMADSSKGILNNQDAPTRTHTKSQILLYRFLDEYT